MKVEIKQETLLKAIEKGGIAALSEEAQSDVSNFALLIKSLKINFGTNFSVESCTNLMASRYFVEAKEENGISVSEEGSAFVPAKELMDWVKIQGKDTVIKMVFNKLDTPQLLGVDQEEDNEMTSSIKKLGDLKIGSKDENNTSVKWELDSYDPDQFPSVDFTEKGDKLFDMYTQHLMDGFGKTSFSIMKKDAQHLYDNVSIQCHDDDVYMIGTDKKRCALYKIPLVEDLQSKDPILVQGSLVSVITKIVEKDQKLTIHHDSGKGRVFFSLPDMEIRLICPDEAIVKKYPPIEMLKSKKYHKMATISHQALSKILYTAALVNDASALFEFVEADDALKVKAISENGKYKPSLTKTKLDSVDRGSKAVWIVRHLSECLKSVKQDNVTFSIPDDPIVKSMQLTWDGDDTFTYLTMATSNPKYI